MLSASDKLEKLPCDCGLILEISGQACCLVCQEEHQTTSELRAVVQELDRQIISLQTRITGLRIQQVKTQLVLTYRERLRTGTDFKGKAILAENFWKNVHGSPRSSGQSRQAGKQIRPVPVISAGINFAEMPD